MHTYVAGIQGLCRFRDIWVTWTEWRCLKTIDTAGAHLPKLQPVHLSSCTKSFHLISVLTWPPIAFLLLPDLSLQKLNFFLEKSSHHPQPFTYYCGTPAALQVWIVSACESACVVVFFCTIQRKGQNAYSTFFKLKWVYRPNMSTASLIRDRTRQHSIVFSLYSPIINITFFFTLLYAQIFLLHTKLGQNTYHCFWCHRQHSLCACISNTFTGTG